MRITGQLIDAIGGAHLWADRFDGSMEDVFDLQDSVALSVAGVIEPALEAAKMLRSAQRPTDDLTAYDLYLRARAAGQSWDKQGVLRALDLLGQALERDPSYGSALALVATCHLGLHLNGWGEDQERNRQQGIEYARRALQAASKQYRAKSNASALSAGVEQRAICAQSGRDSSKLKSRGLATPDSCD